MIQRRSELLSVVLLAAASTAACVPATSQNAAAGPLPPAFDARTVDLHLDWRGGPSVSGSWVLHLERQGDSYTFTGTSEMSSGSVEGNKRAGPLPVSVPDSAMLAFLRALASTPRRRGVYETIQTHTDDYPEFTITLRSDAGVVEFFSDSHTTRNWRVTIGGEQYVSDSSVPFDAQNHTNRFDRFAELNRLLDATPAVRE